MKATKKIVGAACALVAAVALSAGSTFAWFATNNAVSASGLQLTVNTASSYLLIGNSTQDTRDEIIAAKSGNSITTEFQAGSKELQPVAHLSTLSSSNITSTGENSVWITKIADAAGGSTSSTQDAAATKVDPSAYVLTDTLYFTVKKGTGDSLPLHAQSVTVTAASNTAEHPTVQAVSIILVCGTNVVEYQSENGTAWSVTSNNGTKLADTVTDSSTLVQVDVYVYYDGNDGTVYTNNALNLVGATVDVSFETKADPVP